MEIVIYGSGALGALAAEILMQSGAVETIGFIDDDPISKDIDISGLKVIGTGTDLPKLRKFGIEGLCIAAHDGETRSWIARMAKSLGYEIVSAIDEKANVSSDASIGEGCIIAEGATIEAGASVKPLCFISRNAVVRSAAVIPAGTNVLTGEIVEPKSEGYEREPIVQSER